VEWYPEDTVLAINTKAFAAASDTLLPDGTRHSLVNGVTLPQLRLVLGRSLALEDDAVLSQLLPRHLRLAFLGLGLGLVSKRGSGFW
jgi:hypothetical protein